MYWFTNNCLLDTQVWINIILQKKKRRKKRPLLSLSTDDNEVSHRFVELENGNYHYWGRVEFSKFSHRVQFESKIQRTCTRETHHNRPAVYINDDNI